MKLLKKKRQEKTGQQEARRKSVENFRRARLMILLSENYFFCNRYFGISVRNGEAGKPSRLYRFGSPG